MSNSSSSSHRGRFSDASWYWVWVVAGAALYEVVMLAAGRAGGALSHVVWAANHVDGGYSLRWVLVTGPLFGFLAWLFPHFGWAWGTGLHLIAFVIIATAVLGVVALILH